MRDIDLFVAIANCKKQFEKLRRKNEDCQSAHGDADDLVLSFLNDIGCGEIADAWHAEQTAQGGFWYA
jgi:hypothetical protein